MPGSMLGCRRAETCGLEVEDDGRGIESDELAKTRSLGLKGMRERVAYLGGAVEIATRAARRHAGAATATGRAAAARG